MHPGVADDPILSLWTMANMRSASRPGAQIGTPTYVNAAGGVRDSWTRGGVAGLTAITRTRRQMGTLIQEDAAPRPRVSMMSGSEGEGPEDGAKCAGGLR